MPKSKPLLICIALLALGLVLACAAKRPPALEKEPSCLRQGTAGKTLISPACITQDVGFPPGLTRQDLGNLIVVPFTYAGQAYESQTRRLISHHGDERFGATQAFIRQLMNAGLTLVERDPQLTQEMLKEFNYSSDGLVDMETAPAIGNHMGGKTLIVGRFEFTGDFDVARDETGNDVLREPRKISYQALRVKGLDIEKGVILFDIRLTMGENVSKSLLPEQLAAFAGHVLLERFGQATQGGGK